MATAARVPPRQIRALYDDETITLYQAYSTTIASAAVAQQKLDASPQFKRGRTTWFKPSWTWMMYRCGYSYKDQHQERVLAIKIRRDVFANILRRGWVAEPDLSQKEPHRRPGGARKDVVIQWDPERGVRLEKLDHRSIQVGMGPRVVQELVAPGGGIVRIEDVTDRARDLKRLLDEDAEGQRSSEELAALGLLPMERVWEVSDELKATLHMDI